MLSGLHAWLHHEVADLLVSEFTALGNRVSEIERELAALRANPVPPPAPAGTGVTALEALMVEAPAPAAAGPTSLD